MDCGGCASQTTGLRVQLASKVHRLVDELVRHGVAQGAEGVAAVLQPIIASPSQWRYRSRMDFHVGRGDRRWTPRADYEAAIGTEGAAEDDGVAPADAVVVGQFPLNTTGKWHARILDVDDCMIIDEAHRAVLAVARRVLSRHPEALGAAPPGLGDQRRARRFTQRNGEDRNGGADAAAHARMVAFTEGPGLDAIVVRTARAASLASVPPARHRLRVTVQPGLLGSRLRPEACTPAMFSQLEQGLEWVGPAPEGEDAGCPGSGEASQEQGDMLIVLSARNADVEALAPVGNEMAKLLEHEYPDVWRRVKAVTVNWQPQSVPRAVRKELSRDVSEDLSRAEAVRPQRARWTPEEFSTPTTMMWESTVKTVGDYIAGRGIPVRGEPWLLSKLCIPPPVDGPAADSNPVTLMLETGSTLFSQSNWDCACLLYSEAWRAFELALDELSWRERSQPPRVWDLCCGAGPLTMVVALSSYHVFGIADVIGIELQPYLIELADGFVSNLGLQGMARFEVGDVGEDSAWLDTMSRHGAPDIVMLNPPRSGVKPGVMRALAATEARALVYVSCNPDTLARDLAVLQAADPRWRLRSLTPVDMFPHTPHVEAVALMVRK